jgi:hypothetical protein
LAGDICDMALRAGCPQDSSPGDYGIGPVHALRCECAKTEWQCRIITQGAGGPQCD